LPVARAYVARVSRDYWDGTQWTTMPDELRAAEPWYRPAQFAYAGFWIRVLANLIDTAFLFVPTGLLALVEVLPNVEGLAVELARLIAVLLTAAYFVICWSRGGTPGMRILGLAVVHAETGERIGVVRAIIRYLGYVVGALFCYVGWLWVAFDADKQGWHDKLATTIVVYT
jgi:uncharacterized RDD family membrane protein YckC